jgi:hypothetical protein
VANFVASSSCHLEAVLTAELELVQQDPARLRSFYEASELPFPKKPQTVALAA